MPSHLTLYYAIFGCSEACNSKWNNNGSQGWGGGERVLEEWREMRLWLGCIVCEKNKKETDVVQVMAFKPG